MVHASAIPQFRCDEKGFLAICAFGLPGRSHEDGPARGIQAALAIVEAVKVGWREEASLTNRVAEMLAGWEGCRLQAIAEAVKRAGVL